MFGLTASAAETPNVAFVLADDLGYDNHLRRNTEKFDLDGVSSLPMLPSPHEHPDILKRMIEYLMNANHIPADMSPLNPDELAVSE